MRFGVFLVDSIVRGVSASILCASVLFSCLVCAIGSLEESPLCVGRRELFMFVVVIVAFVHHTCRSLCDCHLCDCHLVRLSFVCGCHCALVLCVLVICAIVICSI